MDKGKRLVFLACVSTVSILFICCTGIYGSGTLQKKSSRMRADVITIDSMAAFGALEKAPVEFLHEAHTEALSKKNLDCTACHPTKNGRISPKFKKMADTDRIEAMNTYHQGCISCHGEMRVAREKTGPVECDGCHRPKQLYSSSAQPMGFDKALHFRHTAAQENKCGRCHHEYDEKTEMLIYAKGKEGSCRYCHKTEKKDDVISMRVASHTACINCHLENAPKNIENGPINCSGCHDPAEQRKIKKPASIQRIDRNQPDTVLINTVPKGLETDLNPNRMQLVPFDHKAHETYNDTCRVCHHESMESCSQCHTLAGAREGKWVNLEGAMHQMDTEKSCKGCHEKRQKEKQCAGCHALMGKTDGKDADACMKCHRVPVGDIQGISHPGDEKQLAAEALEKRIPVTGTFQKSEIPEKVIIKHLSEEYEPVDFPHRKMVDALVKNIKDDKLAGYFHNQEGTVCKGCHHNSPVSRKPPQCASCHGRSYDKKNPLKPGIVGAYHQQCMGCHQEMDIQQPAGCTDCHKKKSTIN